MGVVDLKVGLDISTTRVRAVHVSLVDDVPHLVGLAERELPENTSSSATIEQRDLVAAAIGAALRELKVPMRRGVLAVASISSEAAIMTNVASSATTLPAERAGAAKFAAASLNEWPIDECAIIVRPNQYLKNNFLVAKVQKAAIRSRAAVLEAAGVRAHLDIEMLSLRRALPNVDAILDVGHRRSTLSVFSGLGHCPETRTFTFGSATIVDNMVQDENMDVRDAERALHASGPSRGTEHLVTGFVSRLASAIRDFELRHIRIESIGIVGGGAALPNLAKIVGEATGVRNATVAQLENVVSDGLPDAVFRKRAPELALAIGNALWDAPIYAIREDAA